MRVHLFDAIDRVSPAYLIGRETGDVMNVAVSDIETLEFFFAHTIGPMFTVILLPVTTVVLAWRVSPLYAWVLIPIYLLISIVLPLIALKAGRGIGMPYRERLGTLKSKILESALQHSGHPDLRRWPAHDAGSGRSEPEVNRAGPGADPPSPDHRLPAQLLRVPGADPDPRCAPGCWPPGAPTILWAP